VVYGVLIKPRALQGMQKETIGTFVLPAWPSSLAPDRAGRQSGCFTRWGKIKLHFKNI